MTDFSRAPHQGHLASPVPGAPNAALLIDFDNVTMGIRSDLTKELKKLLNSDIIKGKVAVQRAYADWRRYPQYIVPLSEASVDLIFAPAYGSSKKNATDIRLAIDALEIVFTRPEIGTYILLSGDSDFSSLVLKLKEYGKYVIGVGLKESTSDLLVQNCDEYYSYSALTGLTRAGEERAVTAEDPWVLVERAVRQMDADGDVMRSDRLKQVMLQLDPSFDEKGLGFSKFNRFLAEAAGKGALQIKKLENGQYEVAMPGATAPTASAEKPAKEGRSRRDSGSRRGGERRDGESKREPREAREPKAEAAPVEEERKAEPAQAPVEDHTVQAVPRPRRGVAESEMERAYGLLRQAVGDLAPGGEAARDSDVKRRMLEIDSSWDESEIGFSKFSRFLRQAHDAEVVNLRKTSEGYYEVVLPAGSSSSGGGRRQESRGGRRDDRRDSRRRGSREEKPRREETREEARAEGAETGRRGERAREEAPQGEPVQEAPALAAEARDEAPEAAAAPAESMGGLVDEVESAPVEEPASGGDGQRRSAGPASRTEPASQRVPLTGRRGSRSRHHEDGPPPLLPGQAVSSSGRPGRTGAAGRSSEQAPGTGEGGRPQGAPDAAQPEGTFAPARYNLPVEAGAVIRYLCNSYKGVGKKTAEQLIEEFGAGGVFTALATQPDRVRDVLGAGRRTDQLIEAWEADFERRKARAAAPGR